MAYFHDTAGNVAVLEKLFGFEPLACKAWLRCEAQGVNNPTNPLNIRKGGVTTSLQTGSIGDFAKFATVERGLYAAHVLINKLAPNYGYGQILAAANTHDAYRQARSIERSSWAAGLYGSTATSDGCLSRYVRDNVTTVESDMQLSDKVTLGDWIPKAFPNDKGLADGTIRVNTALGSTYGAARQANERSAMILAQLTAQQATIDTLVKVISNANPIDAATLSATIKQAVDDAIAHVTVSLSVDG